MAFALPVIAAMTVGKDVVMLFTDVVNCIQTQNIELKKLVYLYLINYAKSQPDLAILAVNTFVKDTQVRHRQRALWRRSQSALASRRQRRKQRCCAAVRIVLAALAAAASSGGGGGSRGTLLVFWQCNRTRQRSQL